jgi:uncharacterized protein (DUF2235 family)
MRTVSTTLALVLPPKDWFDGKHQQFRTDGSVSMGCNLVLSFDGTNNPYAVTTKSVVSIYAMLDREPKEQLSYYQPRIGTFAPPGVWEKFKRQSSPD